MAYGARQARAAHKSFVKQARLRVHGRVAKKTAKGTPHVSVPHPSVPRARQAPRFY